MMDIPIDDQHFADPVTSLGVARRHRDVIEHTEPHSSVGCSMMPWRSNDTEGIFGPAVQQRVDGRQGGADRMQRRLPGPTGNRRVTGAQMAMPALDIVFSGLDVTLRMAASDLGFVGCARVQPQDSPV